MKFCFANSSLIDSALSAAENAKIAKKEHIETFFLQSASAEREAQSYQIKANPA